MTTVAGPISAPGPRIGLNFIAVASIGIVMSSPNLSARLAPGSHCPTRRAWHATRRMRNLTQPCRGGPSVGAGCRWDTSRELNARGRELDNRVSWTDLALWSGSEIRVCRAPRLRVQGQLSSAQPPRFSVSATLPAMIRVSTLRIITG